MQDSNTLYSGQVIDDKFKVIDLLGQGGMGAVYKAEQMGLGRTVALKLLKSVLISDSESQMRFTREAQVLSRLNHKYIGSFYSFGLWQMKVPYIAMEFVEGKTLTTILNLSDKLPWQDTLKMSISACQALAHSHKQAVLHRDIKPSNIILLSESELSQIKIIDFGLAKITGDEENLQKLTQTGALVGSANYMSPELCRGEPVDERSDIYALACVLYQCLCGKLPHEADNPVGLLHKHINEDVLPPSLAGADNLPEGLDEVVLKGLARDRQKRYQSMADLESDLLLVLQNHGSRTRARLEAEKSSGRSKKNSNKIAVCLLLLTMTVAGSILFLNSPGGIEFQIDCLLRSVPNKSKLESSRQLLKRLLNSPEKSARASQLQNAIIDQARTVSSIEAAKMCQTLMNEDKEHALSWACKGLSLLSSATTKPDSEYVDLIESFSKLCASRKERNPGLSGFALDAIDTKLRNTDINHKSEFLNLYVQTLRFRGTSVNLIQNLTYLGGIYAHRKNFASAKTVFDEAESECRKLQNPEQQLIELYLKEAQSFSRAGLNNEALKALHNAERLLVKFQDELIEQQCFHAHVALECGQLKRAEEVALHGLELAQRKLPVVEGAFKGSRFMFKSLQTRTEKELQKGAEAIARTSCDLSYVLLDAYKCQGNLKKAQELYDRAFSPEIFWENARSSHRFEAFLSGCLNYDRLAQSRAESLEKAAQNWLSRKLDSGNGLEEQRELEHYFNVYKEQKMSSKAASKT